MAKPVWTLDQIVANLERDNVAWAAGDTVAYAFYEQPNASAGTNLPGFSAFSAAQREATDIAYQLVADFTKLDFVRVADNGPATPDNQRIALFNIDHADAPFWGVADVTETPPEGDGRGEITNAEVAINQYRAKVQGGWEAGDSNVRKLTHEILHTLGLPHPGEYDGGGFSYEDNAEYAQDSLEFTVMSYWDAAETGADHTRDGVTYYAATPLLHDIAVLQAIYGANMTTRHGDTTYGFNANAGREAYDFTVNDGPVVCIWDGGGVDTLDVSGFSYAARIDLNQGGFSDVGGLTRNVSIAFGARIENAVGGAAADHLTGNTLANRLMGGAGADILVGGRGADTLTGGAGVDTVDFSGRTWEVHVDLGLGEASSRWGEDRLTTIENVIGSSAEDALIGNAAANRLEGGSGADFLSGGGRGDVLWGGQGADTLIGGAGADVFLYAATGESSRRNSDLITDLGGGDVIDLSAIDADTGVEGDQAFALASSFTGEAGQARLVWSPPSGRTLLQLDVDGDRRADMTVLIAGDHTEFDGFVL